MHGDAIAAAAEAFERGMIDFFRNPAVRAGVKMEIESIRAVMRTALEPLDSGQPSTRSPEDSESSPGPSPSAT
jgi:hypothetical protein